VLGSFIGGVQAIGANAHESRWHRAAVLSGRPP